MKLLAQKLENPVLDSSIRNLEGVSFLGRLIPMIFAFLLTCGTLLFLIQFILAGIKWINNQGTKDKIVEAQKEITYAVIGLFTMFFVFLAMKVIGKMFGIEGFENLRVPIPTL